MGHTAYALSLIPHSMQPPDAFLSLSAGVGVIGFLSAILGLPMLEFDNGRVSVRENLRELWKLCGTILAVAAWIALILYISKGAPLEAFNRWWDSASVMLRLGVCAFTGFCAGITAGSLCYLIVGLPFRYAWERRQIRRENAPLS